MKKVILLSGVLALLSFGFGGKKKIKTPENFVFIPSCSDKLGETNYSVQAFFMSDHEVTNAEYRLFLADLKNSGQDSAWALAYPDTSGWNSIGGYCEPMIANYFSHPAYANYPVVNISKEGADLYCQWLTRQLRKEYGDEINDVRLPTKYEWIVAAKGGHRNAIYPWNGPYVRNTEGEFLANFIVIGEQNIRMTESGPEIVSDSSYAPGLLHLDNAFYTATSKSYRPNDFGLYNMSGNVAELTAEGVAMGGHWRSYGYDIRVTSEIPFENPNPYVGFRPVSTYIKKSE